MFWLHFSKGRYFSTRAKSALTIINVGVLVIGFTISADKDSSVWTGIIRLYVSGRSINESTTNFSWSCADKSKS
ncbi:amino acid transporter [Penicillium daleae]|uniref:Amino acid transporter n=1 Tax=Penicillium daleae TaxID=63821 RepID=A0AAD6C098_9EURO|nr:amino acid transporter [Penicillium daleae]KAJ5438729.1 amino acid transporter [Penicillium daleae]